MMNDVLDMAQLQPGMTVMDATLGGGGYTREIYKRIMPGGTLIACDQDMRAIDRFTKNFPDIAQHIHIVHSNYSHIRKIFKDEDIRHVDVIVADLGLSSDQIGESDRGFSFSTDSIIDMRMDQGESVSASDVVNSYTLADLTQIISEYSDERWAYRIARAICEHRPIISTKKLAEVIVSAVPQRVQRTMHIHPATKTFQAIRIAVNDEYAHLKVFLTEGIELLPTSGRFIVVSFHSGEDRLVKNIFRAHARGCVCPVDMPICQCGHVPELRILTKKPLGPSEEEVKKNPRSRSARLRGVVKL